MPLTRDQLDSFFTGYGDTLARFDGEATAEHWGEPGTMVTDAFVGVLESREQMAAGLAQAHPLYRALGLAGVRHTILEQVTLTPALTRVHVRWHFDDTDGQHMIDGEYEYLLRETSPGKPLAVVAVGLDDPEELRQLARERGVDLDAAAGQG